MVPLSIHIYMVILGTMLFFLFAGIGRNHYQSQMQHPPMGSNATHVDVLYGVHEKQFTALREELTTVVKDVRHFTTITNNLLLPPEIIQKIQTAGGHIEQLQKAAACEGTGPSKAEAFALALKQQRELSLCEWLSGWEAAIDMSMTYEALRVCRLEAGDAVMTADGNIVRAQALNDGYWGDKERPIGDEQALLHMELDVCQEILESREEFVRDTGDFVEGKFLRSSVVGEWRVR